MAKNFIKLERRLMRSEVYRSAPVVRELFIWLLLNVGWRTRQEKNEDDKYGVGRGQWKGTLDDIRKGLSWKSGFRTEMYSKAQIQRALKKLDGMGNVEYMGDTRGISLSVCNFDNIQGSSDTGRNTSESKAKRVRNVPENVKDISYNNIYNKDISLNKDKEKEEVEETPYSASKAFAILKIVEPVFGNLSDPFYGLGGITKWGSIVWGAINTYTYESVELACKMLVKLKAEGSVEVNNPDVFFKKGLPGYIVRAKNETAEIEKVKKSKEWTGYCTECDHKKVFPSQPSTYENCENCNSMYYQSKFYYDHEKAAVNPQPIKEPVDKYADVRDDEDFQKVQSFLKGFGGGTNNS
tara:strand:- start:5048 stop:6103 length:1056 start_codon:yes stop_codon:yes gene_type:complete